MPENSHAIRIPVPGVDAIHRHNRAVSMIGPLRMPTRERLVQALIEIASIGPGPRVGLTWHGDGRAWVYDPEVLPELCDSLIEERIGDGPDAFRELMPHLTLTESEQPVARWIIVGDYLIQSSDHSIGDVGMLTGLPVALLEVAEGRPVPDWLAAASAGHPLRTALWQTFRSPKAVRELRRARREERARLAVRSDAETPAADASPTASPWTPSPAYSVGVLEGDALKDLRHWLRGPGGGASLNTALLTVMRRAFSHHEIVTADQVSMIYDSRRYLPAGVTTRGNFITGLPVDASDDLGGIDGQVKRAAESGRPLAALAVGAARARLTAEPGGLPDRADAHPVARITMSDGGVSRALAAAPWTAPERDRLAVFTVGPTPPDEVGVLAAIVGASVQVVVSYNDNVFDVDRVESAVAQAVREPVTLLAEPAHA